MRANNIIRLAKIFRNIYLNKFPINNECWTTGKSSSLDQKGGGLFLPQYFLRNFPSFWSICMKFYLKKLAKNSFINTYRRLYKQGFDISRMTFKNSSRGSLFRIAFLIKLVID